MGVRHQCYHNLLAQQTWDYELFLYVMTRGGRVPGGKFKHSAFEDNLLPQPATSK